MFICSTELFIYPYFNFCPWVKILASNMNKTSIFELSVWTNDKSEGAKQEVAPLTLKHNKQRKCASTAMDDSLLLERLPNWSSRRIDILWLPAIWGVGNERDCFKIKTHVVSRIVSGFEFPPCSIDQISRSQAKQCPELTMRKSKSNYDFFDKMETNVRQWEEYKKLNLQLEVLLEGMI